MKTSFWIFLTELIQNKMHFSLVAAVSFLLGLTLVLAGGAYKKISTLSQPTNWKADLAVLPKGISLTDFREELLTGKSRELLPDALFETTVGLVNSNLVLTAFLSLSDGEGSRVMIRTNQPKYQQLGWLEERQKISYWSEQKTYSTPEWGYKVITGFTASGDPVAIQKLSEIINKKSVAQAIFIQRQQAIDEQQQSDLKSGLYAYTGAFVALALLAKLSLFFWIRVRINNSLETLQEMGFASVVKRNLSLALMVVSFLFPLMLGTFLGSFF